MKRILSLTVLALMLSIGSVLAESETKLPSRSSALEAALQRQGAPEVSYSPLIAAGSCTATSTTLCLQGNRFALTVDWVNQHASPAATGVGEAVVDTDQTGFFWFFSEQSIELVVKVVDGRAVNGKFWVFYGALSDVEYTITVTDTQTSAVKIYHNPPGNVSGGADTSAFADSLSGATVEVSSLPARFAAPGPGPSALSAPRYTPLLLGPPSCTPSAEHLCLLGNRFEVSVAWINQHPPGGTGLGSTITATDQSGYFWFFDPASVELVVKIVDGGAVNGKFWVFYGALTDVEYTITVRDTETGTVETYHNAPANISGRADTSAFDSPGGTVDPADLAGDWSGTWDNASFDTQGPATMTVSVDTAAHTFSVLLTFGGNVFGGSPPPPQTFNGSYTPGGSGTFTQDSPFFGHVTLTIGADGSVTGSMTNLSDPGISRVDFTGAISSTQVNIDYTISFSAGGGSAVGTVSMTKN